LKEENTKIKKKKQEDSNIESNDSFNRTLYGSPTIGGFIIIGLIIIFVLYQMFFK
jgi:hypothetical protein